MHNIKIQRQSLGSIQHLVVVVAVAALTFLPSLAGQARAAVQGVGDVTPQEIFTDIPFGFGVDEQLVDITGPALPFSGGRLQVDDGMGGNMDADLVVGGTGVFSGTTLEDGTQIGTTTGSVSINSPTNTLPLITTNVFIGKESNGRGRITLTDFGTTLIAENELIIGEEGEGELRLINGSRVGVGIYNIDPTIAKYEGGTTIIGQMRDTSGANQFLSQGLVSIDGYGTLFETEDLMVADEGLGTVQISGKGKLSTVNTTLGEESGATGRLTLTGLYTQWTNTEDLIIGNNGTGLVEVNDFAILVSDTITVGSTSFVDLKGGKIISNSTLSNGGVIRGHGTIESDLTIANNGELRNYGETGVYNPGESMLVTGTVSNNGTIQSLGGEMEFQSSVTNSREIIARDTVLHFRGGLTNDGTVTIGGDTTLHGDITSGSNIHVLAGSEATLVGDLIFSGGALALTAGPAAGTLDVIGMIDLSAAATTLKLEYSAGVFAQAGDTYEILDSTLGVSGTFANAPSTGNTITDDKGNVWDVTYNPTSVWVTATGLTAPIPMGDFDVDGDVDGTDFLSWQRGGSPNPVSAADLAIWQADYGAVVLSSTATTAAVPEPSTLALALLTLVCCPRRRRHS